METLIVAMLNALGAGTNGGSTGDLLQTPAQYNPGLWDAAVGLHNVAVKPISGLVLAIVAVMAISAGASRFDQGDGQMGIRMIGAAAFRIVMALIVTQSSLQILEAINGVAVRIATAGDSMAVGPAANGAPLGDTLKSQIADLGMTKQIVVIVILLLPYIVKVIVGVLATVIIFARFLQLDIMTAFASLPIAFSAMDATRSIAIGYLKRYAAVALQGAVLLIAMKLYNALMAGWISSHSAVDSNTDVWALITGNIGQFMVAPFVLAFIRFGSSSIARSIRGEG